MASLNISFSKDKNRDREIKKTISCVAMVTFSSIIYCLGVIWFITPANLYSGGVTGIAQLIVSFFGIFDIELDLGILVMVINIPILAYGWRAVSKRFVICSIISIVIQTVMLSNLVSPHLFLNLGINSGEKDVVLLAFTGGFVCGFGSALALRFGTSTGGVDVLAQAITFKKGISIGQTSLITNVLIAIGGALINKNATIAFYTIIRIIVQSVITDRIHTSYNYVKVEIISNAGEQIAQELMIDVRRGVTEILGKGAYTHQDKYILETVVSSYEVQRVVEISKKIDPHAFVCLTPIKKVFGNFAKNTIA